MDNCKMVKFPTIEEIAKKQSETVRILYERLPDEIKNNDKISFKILVESNINEICKDKDVLALGLMLEGDLRGQIGLNDAHFYEPGDACKYDESGYHCLIRKDSDYGSTIEDTEICPHYEPCKEIKDFIKNYKEIHKPEEIGDRIVFS